MNLKTVFILTLTLLVVMLVIPAMLHLVAAAQVVPPPALPEQPDQSPLWCGALVFLMAMIFGVWRMLYTRK